MHTLLLLALLGCPRPAGAIETTLIETSGHDPDGVAADRSVSDNAARELAELAAALEARGDALGPAGAQLARALVAGHADASVRGAARELLVALNEAEAPSAGAESTGLADASVPEPTSPEPTAEGLAADARAVAAVAPGRIARARESLRLGEYEAAIETLSLLADSPSWVDAEPFYAEAVDGFVGAERERIGQLYVAARKLSGEARRTALLAVREQLAGLVEAYPGSVYYEPLLDNLERVERELDAG